jgi:hypothetical protein
MPPLNSKFQKAQVQDNVKEIIIDGRKLRIRKFDITDMTKVAPNPSVAMIAKRGSGKSWAIRELMWQYRDIPGGVVISRTEKMSPFFQKFFPDMFIYYRYESEILQSFLERQERIKEKKQQKVKVGKKIDSRAWLIMDDCLAHKGSWMKDENIMEVFMNGRHYDLFFILTMQYPLGIGPDLRSNFDFIFIFGENFTNIQKKIYEHYAGMFPTFDAFRLVFRKCTSNFGCMVINNRVKSENVDDLVFWWRAPTDPRPNKYVGQKSFVKYHERHYDNDYKEKDKFKKIDIYGAMGRKKQCNLKVELVDQ